MRLRKNPFVPVLAAALLALAAMPGTALAQGEEVIRDCAQDGDLDRDYSDEELEDASNNLPSDIDEYSNCRDVIRQAQAGGDGSPDDGAAGPGDGTDGGTPGGGTDGDGDGGAGPGGGGEDDGGGGDDRDEPTSPEEPGTPADTPADVATDTDGDDSGLPTAAIVALVVLALAALGGGLYAIRDRLPGFGSGQGR